MTMIILLQSTGYLITIELIIAITKSSSLVNDLNAEDGQDCDNEILTTGAPARLKRPSATDMSGVGGAEVIIINIVIMVIGIVVVIITNEYFQHSQYIQ